MAQLLGILILAGLLIGWAQDCGTSDKERRKEERQADLKEKRAAAERRMERQRSKALIANDLAKLCNCTAYFEKRSGILIDDYWIIRLPNTDHFVMATEVITDPVDYRKIIRIVERIGGGGKVPYAELLEYTEQCR